MKLLAWLKGIYQPVSIAAAGIAFLLGLFAGDQIATDRCTANTSRVNAKAQAALQQRLQEGTDAVARLGEQLREQDRIQSSLRERLKHVQLTVPVASCNPSQRAQDAAEGGFAQAKAVDTGADVRLSLAAIRLWNSALTGNSVPATSCGTVGAPQDTCTVDSGLAIADAWANHQTNAAECAEDRHRLNALIDYLSPTTQP